VDLELAESGNATYVRSKAGAQVLDSERALSSLISYCGEHQTHRVLLFAENLHKDFFNLSSGEAGRLLQRFAAYRFKVAAVLPPECIKGQFSLFVLETNRGGHFRVFRCTDEAEQWLVSEE